MLISLIFSVSRGEVMMDRARVAVAESNAATTCRMFDRYRIQHD